MFPLPNYGSDGCVKDYVCAPANTSSCPLALPGECSDGREPKPVYIKNVAVFSKCSSGEKTSSACGTGSREVKCYVQTDKCQQTGSNKTSAIDVQADSAGCSVHTNQSQCQADVSCSWLSFCSGAKSSGLTSVCQKQLLIISAMHIHVEQNATALSAVHQRLLMTHANIQAHATRKIHVRVHI